MSQTTLTSYFNSRKRPATEDISSVKNKILHVDPVFESKIKVKKTSSLIDHGLPSTAVQNSLKSDSKKPASVPCQSFESESSQDVTQSNVFTKKVNASNVSKNTTAGKSTSVNSARKELSLGDIRKKLSGSSRLAELRATADRLSKGIQDLKATCEKRNLKEFKSIDVEVPSSPSKKALLQNELLSPKKNPVCSPQRPLISPRKVFVSPVKSPSKIPAYLRHASLAASSSLPLPHQYRFLAELFRGMETVVALLHNRNEKITFNKLKPSVQEMLKRNFTEKHLAQIKHIVPDFYTFEIQKNKNFATSSQKESYELIISPNFPNHIKMMNPTVLLERRRFFYDTLLQLAKKHHAAYLASLDPPMVIPDNKLTRWHPEFEIEKVPEVECAKLPEMPNVETFSTAQDVLAKARELFKCNTKMERALQKLAQAKTRGLTEEEKAVTGLGDNKAKPVNNSTQTDQPSASNVTLINPALRNLPASLLEKVKAKQAAKALEAMTRTPQHNEKYLIYSRLPDLAKTLRNIFVTERKNVLALNVIVSKLDSSFRAGVSAEDVHRDIRALAVEAPDWVKLHEIRKAVYLKLDKNADLKKVTAKLEALAEKYKS